MIYFPSFLMDRSRNTESNWGLHEIVSEHETASYSRSKKPYAFTSVTNNIPNQTLFLT